MRLIILSIILVSSAPSFAASKKLANFLPGNYELVKGPAEKCGGGKFEMQEEAGGVQFGDLQGFGIKTGSEVIKSDIPEEADCKYDVRETNRMHGKETILTFQETLRCPGNIRHVLKRTAKVSKGRVVLDIDQKGNPNFDDEETFTYKCEFVKK